ncbi:MAG: hypothetical protein H6590_08145 [Flavobacteriales bacterium]|nr:hypothetical protein [Flavobacteriales bacterium]
MRTPRGRLLPRRDFLRRQVRFLLVAVALVSVALAIGVAGYMGYAGLGFTDAFLNASMILGGMGPVDPLSTNAAKWFASFYALFSGIIMLDTVAVMLTPCSIASYTLSISMRMKGSDPGERCCLLTLRASRSRSCTAR